MKRNPTQRFLTRIAGWVNGIKPRNVPNRYNRRPSKALRREGRFAQLAAFKYLHGLSR